MNVMDRKEHWERAWSARPADEVSWYQDEPARSLAMIEDAGLVPADAVIDVGGGASTLVDHLLRRGHEDLTVLDLSRAALDQARHRLGPKADRVDWIETDVLSFQPTRTYRLWHDRAVFHFLLDAKDRERYAAVLRRALTPGGQAVIATFAMDGPARCSGLDVVRYDAPGLLAALGQGLELVDVQEEEHRTPAGGIQRFGFFRFTRSDTPAPERLQSSGDEQTEET